MEFCKWVGVRPHPSVQCMFDLANKEIAELKEQLAESEINTFTTMFKHFADNKEYTFTMNDVYDYVAKLGENDEIKR